VRQNIWKSLIAVLAGNAIYFLLLPSLPAPARHRPLHLDLGLLIDAWFCVAAYGILAMISRQITSLRKDDT
jgi:hypothetical protein